MNETFPHLTILGMISASIGVEKGRQTRLLGLAVAMLLAVGALAIPGSRPTYAQTELPTVSLYATETVVIREGDQASFTVVVTPAQTTALTVKVGISQSHRVVHDGSLSSDQSMRTVLIPAGQSHATVTVQTRDHPNKNDYEPHYFPQYDADTGRQIRPGYLTPFNGPNECAAVSASIAIDPHPDVQTPTYNVGSPNYIVVDVYDANAITSGCNVNEDSSRRRTLANAVSIMGGADVTEGGTAQYTLSIEPAAHKDFTVNLMVSDASDRDASNCGNKDNCRDFVAADDEGSQSVNIASGATSATFSVATTDDSTDEPDGDVVVSISAGEGYYPANGASSASVGVQDDDATSMRLAGNGASFPETGGTTTVIVSMGRKLAPPEALTVTLNFGGSATFGTDYTVSTMNFTGISYGAPSGGSMTVTYTGVEANMQSNVLLNVSMNHDTDYEGDETVIISMGALTSTSGTNLGGGAVIAGNPVTFSITDDDAPPPSVSGVSISARTQTSATATVNIAHAGSAQKTAYLRYRESGGSWGTTQSGTTNGASHAFNLTGLTAATTYEVEASLDSGFASSQTATFTTRAAPSVSSVAFSNVTQASATATVNIANPGNSLMKTAFLRYRASNGQWIATKRQSTSGARPDFVLSGLTAGTTYEAQAAIVVGVVISATNSHFTGAQTYTFTTSANTPTLTPRVSSVTFGNVAQTSATATVNIANPGNSLMKTAFLRYRASGAQQWSAALRKSTNGARPDFALSNLTAGTTYQVQAAVEVGSVLSATNSHFAEAQTYTFATSARTQPPPPPPPPSPSVSSVSVSGVTQTSATATVNIANAGSGSKTVYMRYGLNGGAYGTARSANTSGSSRAFSLTGLSAGTTYTVQASLSSSFSQSRTATFTTNAVPQETPPSSRSSDSISRPNLGVFYISDITQISAVANAEVENHGNQRRTVYLRHRELGAIQWNPVNSKTTDDRSRVSFYINNLEPATTCEVQVSLDSDFETYKSAVFTTLPPDPSVSDVGINGITQTSATATVNIADAGTAQKKVYLRHRESGATRWGATQTKTTAGASAAFNLTGLTASTKYDVEASLASDFSASQTAAFTTLSPDPSLSAVSISDVTQTSATATVNIADAGTAQKKVYLRYRESDAGQWGVAKAKTTTGASAVFSLTGLTASTKYDVEAAFASDVTASKTVSFTTLAPVPGVSAVSISDVTQTSATATVAIANAGKANKTVYLRHRESGASQWGAAKTMTTAGASAAFSLTGLTTSTQYDVEAALASDFTASKTASFTTLAPDPSISAVSISDITQTSATVTVNMANPGTTKKMVYLIYRVNEGPSSALQSVTTTFANATFNLAGLTANTQYEVEVFLHTDVDAIVSRTFKTLSHAPVVSSVSVSDIGRTSATASARIANVNGSSQTVHLQYRTTTPQGSWITTQTATSKSDSASISLSGLAPGVRYDVRASLDSDFVASQSAGFTTLRAASVYSVAAGNIGTNGATISVTIADAHGENQTVYLRYRATRYNAWHSTRNAIAEDGAASLRLMHLSSNIEYVVEVSLDNNFPAVKTQSVTFRTLRRNVGDGSSVVNAAQVASGGGMTLLGVNPHVLKFEAVEGGENPMPQAFSLWNRATGSMEFTLSKQQEWLSLTPMTGASMGPNDKADIVAPVNIAGLTAAQYVDIINVHVRDAGDEFDQVIVVLDVLSSDYIRQFVSQHEGGTVELPDGAVMLVVPPGTPPSDVDVELEKVVAETRAAPPQGNERVVLALASNAYQPEGEEPQDIAFAPSAELWLMLPEGDAGACAESRVAFYAIEADDAWNLVEHRCETDEAGNVWAVAQVDLLGGFALTIIDEAAATPTQAAEAVLPAAPPAAAPSVVAERQHPSTPKEAPPAQQSPASQDQAQQAGAQQSHPQQSQAQTVSDGDNDKPEVQAAAPDTTPTMAPALAAQSTQNTSTAAAESSDDGFGIGGIILAALWAPMLIGAPVVIYIIYRERRRRVNN